MLRRVGGGEKMYSDKVRTPFLMAFGRRLRAARKAIGLRQREVADLLGVSEGAYRAYENAWARMTVDLVVKLPQTLHRPLLYFFGMAKRDLDLTEEEWAILQGYRAIRSPEVKNLVREIIKQGAHQTVVCQNKEH